MPALLWAGQVASTTGDRLYGVALLWSAAVVTHSAAGVAVVSVADTAPFLIVSTVSGWFADRTDALRLARATDLIRAGLVALLPGFFLIGWFNLASLAIVAAGLSAFEAFFLPSLQASLPRLVPRSRLAGMVSLLDTTDRLGRILGPGVIGLLGTLPEIHLYTIDAASFLVSAACLTLILRPARRRQGGPGAVAGAAPNRPDRTGLLAGWRETARRPVLRYALLVRAGCNLMWPAFTLATPFVVADRYRHGIGGYGLVLAAFGVGNLLGAIAAVRIPTGWLASTGNLAWAGAGLGFVGLAAAPNYAVFLIAAVATGVWTPLANVTVNTAIAALLPTPVLARAYAAQRVAVVGAGLIGLPVTAVAMNHLGPSETIGVAGLLIIVIATAALIATTTSTRAGPATDS